MDKPTVFLSSTYKDLEEHRALLLSSFQKLSIPVIAMEHFGSLPNTPLNECQNAVKKCNIFILIIGTKYGELTETGKSMTENEYDTAQEIGLDTFVYILDKKSHPVLPAYVDTGNKENKLNTFRSKLQKNHIYSKFSSKSDLAIKVNSDLIRYISTLRISDEINTSISKQLSLPKLLTGGAYGIDFQPTTVIIEKNITESGNNYTFNNIKLSCGFTAVYIATSISESNFNVLKGFFTFDLVTWKIIISLLKILNVDESALSREIIHSNDYFHLRLLIALSGELKISACADAICKTARFINKTEVMNEIKKISHPVTPFFDVVTDSLSKMTMVHPEVIMHHLNEAKRHKQWKAYKAIKRAAKNLNIEQVN